MGYLPQYENDIIISYKHASNKLPDRWVDTFQKVLEAQLEYRIGKVKFWRDTEGGIQGGDEWLKQIYEALDTTAIFLAILTPQYIRSDVCVKELDYFLKRFSDPNAAIKPVIMPVHQLPPEDKLPPELTSIQDVKFFRQEPLLEFTPEGENEAEKKFFATLVQLAQILSEKLKMLRGELRKQMAGTVHLGVESSWLQEEREAIRADLLQRGYWVVPEHPYLWNSADLESTIASEIGTSDLCVHLIGPADPNEPETHAHARLQLERAVEIMKRKGRPAPVVWIKPGTGGDDVNSLIAYVKQELPNHGGDWCEGSLEDFKNLIISKLPKPATSPAGSTVPKPSDLALIVERNDVSAARKLQEILVNTLECDVQIIQLADFTPNEAVLPIKVPSRCNKCIIFWGTQTEDRVRDILAIDALAPYRGKQRLCVYIAPPEIEEKRGFLTPKARVIPGISTTDEAELRDFIKSAEVAS